MPDIDVVTDITFSQPMSTAAQVADVIMQLAVNDKRERSMPPISGFLTTVSYLMPWLSTIMRPLLDRKGVYNRVTIDFVTHSADGITDLDFQLAAKMNELADTGA